MRLMNRRFSAWVALLSMLAGIVLPAHGHGRMLTAGGSGSDFCAAGPAADTPSVPPANGRAADCDMCSGCVGGAAAPPGASIVTPALSPETTSPLTTGLAAIPANGPSAAYPRGPPRAR
jgi:hypothetical protein